MTGFATRRGSLAPDTSAGDAAVSDVRTEWVWDLRAVNGKGLDLRLRLPDGIDGLEMQARAMLAARVQRGSVTLTLKLSRAGGGDALRVNPGGLAGAMVALGQVVAAATAAGIAVAPVRPEAVLMLRGVAENAGQGGAADGDPQPVANPDFGGTAGPAGTGPSGTLLSLLCAELVTLIDDFNTARAVEGQALARIVGAQIDRIAALHLAAVHAAETRREPAARALADAMARIAAVPGADPARVAQELALLAVKADVTEELDRLAAHVDAARGLIAAPGPVGRKLDFLMQEFMREANTLCAKSGAAALTGIGLDLKEVIDQMREQVQNVE